MGTEKGVFPHRLCNARAGGLPPRVPGVPAFSANPPMQRARDLPYSLYQHEMGFEYEKIRETIDSQGAVRKEIKKT